MSKVLDMQISSELILVRIDSSDEETTGAGIILKQSKKSSIDQGTVVKADMAKAPFLVKDDGDVSTTVAFSAYKGFRFEEDGKDYAILEVDDILFYK